MNHQIRTESRQSAFKVAGGIYTLTTFELHTASPALIEAQLKEMVTKAPHFFEQSPIVLAFKLPNNHQLPVDLFRINLLLNNYGLRIVAISGNIPSQKQQAEQLGVAWLPEAKQDTNHNSSNVVMINPETGTPVTRMSAPQQPEHHKTLHIDHPIRSGQQIISQGDLVVTNAVSSGAELLARGSIHVYGPLRGRALAGIDGDSDARIFCQKFEAELISINGQYKIPSAKSQEQLWKEKVLISLDAQSLHIRKL